MSSSITSSTNNASQTHHIDVDAPMGGVPDQPTFQSGEGAPPQTPTRGPTALIQPDTPTRTNGGQTNEGGEEQRGRTLALNPNVVQTPSVPPKEMTKAEKAAAFRRLMTAPDQVEPRGTLNFPSNRHPRCLAARLLWPPYLADDDMALETEALRAKGVKYAWVSVYKTMTVTESEVELFKQGLMIAKEEAVIPDFNPAQYGMDLPAKAVRAFLVGAEDAEALRRLTNKKVWTVRTKTKSSTFFISQDDSWGSHIVYDIHNAGADFMKDVLPRLYQFCGGAIATKETDKAGHVAFRDLAYYQIPFNTKTHKGAKGIIWRVRWVPTPAACANTWSAPRHLGNSGKGTIEVRRPPLCSHCISYSHAQNLCKWWQDDMVAGSNTTPDNFLESTWIPIESVSCRKLGLATP